MAVSHWFLKDDLWHAYNLNAPTALCGEVSIAYGVDPIADFVPEGGEAHGACVSAVDAIVDPEPVPYPEPSSSTPEPPAEEDDEPKPKRRGRPKTK